jgi:hypothetical protein
MMIGPPERWQQIEALFAEAIDTPAAAAPRDGGTSPRLEGPAGSEGVDGASRSRRVGREGCGGSSGDPAGL